MKRFLLLPALVMLALTGTATTPVRAGGSDVAAGLIGGLAAGTIIGAAATAHVTTDRHRYTWHLHRTAIGRAESRCGMGIGAFGPTLLSEFANNSPRGASLERTISCGSTTVAFQSPLLGVKRTLFRRRRMSANDPKRTSSGRVPALQNYGSGGHDWVTWNH